MSYIGIWDFNRTALSSTAVSVKWKELMLFLHPSKDNIGFCLKPKAWHSSMVRPNWNINFPQPAFIPSLFSQVRPPTFPPDYQLLFGDKPEKNVPGLGLALLLGIHLWN